MRQLWTEQDVADLREFVRVYQPFSLLDWEPLAKSLGRTVQACRLKAQKEGLHGYLARKRSAVGDEAAITRRSGTVTSGSSPDTPIAPSLHVKKLHVHVPPSVEPREPDGMIRAVLWSDTHIPFQDEAALRCVAEVVRITQPDVMIHGGDLLDCYRLSRFDQNPKRLHRLQDEIDAARQHLGAMRLLAPKARFVLLEGNHEDRLRRTLWSLPPHAQALMALDAVTETLTWPKLLGLADLDIEFYAYGEQSRANILPKWICKHGSVVRKYSGYTARAEHERYGKSGSSGHTHRLGFNMYRDHNGAQAWTETGCTCSLTPEYAEDPDWAQGCVVLTFEPTTGAFAAEPVYIHNGTCVFRGRWIDARV